MINVVEAFYATSREMLLSYGILLFPPERSVGDCTTLRFDHDEFLGNINCWNNETLEIDMLAKLDEENYVLDINLRDVLDLEMMFLEFVLSSMQKNVSAKTEN